MGFWCHLLEMIINHKVKVNLKNEHGFQNVLVFGIALMTNDLMYRGVHMVNVTCLI